MSTVISTKMTSHNLDERANTYFYRKTENNLQEVVKAAEPLVRHFANKFSGITNYSDLVQEGFEGFIKALKRYVPCENALFTTYACHCILGEIRHFLRKENSFYKAGDTLNINKKIENFAQNFRDGNGLSPSIDEIAKEFNVSEGYVIRTSNSGLISIDEMDLYNTCIVKNDYDKTTLEDRIVLRQSFDKLTILQKKVLYMIYFKGYTQTKVANILGLNQRKVSRVIYKSLEILRKEMNIE